MRISRGLSYVRFLSEFKRFSRNLVSYSYDSPGKYQLFLPSKVFVYTVPDLSSKKNERSTEMPASAAYYDYCLLYYCGFPGAIAQLAK